MRTTNPMRVIISNVSLIVALLLASTPAVNASPGEEAMQSMQREYLADVFELVQSEVVFEPYGGVQRSPQVTALNRRGNAIDQVMLLAALLDDKVAQWRIVSGRLDNASLGHLLARTSPRYESNGDDFSGNYKRYDPINDAAIQKIARNHYWLEIQEEPEDEWLALDPSFPDARIGEAYAKARSHYDTLPANQYQRLTVTLHQETAKGRKQRLARVDGTVAELSQFPISLVVRGIPQYAGEQRKRQSGNSMINGGGLLGGSGFGGSSSEEEPQTEEQAAENERELVGVEYRRELTYGGAAPIAAKPTMVTTADTTTGIKREWLEFRLRVPGQKDRRFTRDLFVATADAPRPAAIRRYTIGLFAGEIDRALFDDYRGALSVAEIRSAEERLQVLKSAPVSNETALEIIQLESSNALVPFLMTAAFAYESDVMTRRLAASAGVRIVRDVPRVLIATVETGIDDDGKVETETTLDLRLDDVTALPLTGMPVAAAKLFQQARGMQESALEGRVLARFVADDAPPLTTERVLRVAQQQGRQLLVLTPDNRTAMSSVAQLPELAAQRIATTLDRGHQIILPEAPASIGGKHHWGWWDVNPTTGAFVGVLQSGQHQAMVQYTVTLEEIGVNDAMGYILGAMVGSTATLTLYSAKMIEYGNVTPQLIDEVAAGIEQLTCVTCPSFEVVVSPVAASASVSSQCFQETGKSIGTGVGASGSIDFCENYKTGISCAASLLLGTFEVEADASIGPNIKADLGPLSCQ